MIFVEICKLSSKFLSNDDLRFLFGVCFDLRNWAYDELKFRAGGKPPDLRYTTAAIHVSPELLLSSKWPLSRKNFGNRASVAFGYLRTFKAIYNTHNSSFVTCFHAAFEHNYIEIAKYLCCLDHEKASSMVSSALTYACTGGFIDTVKFLYKNFALKPDRRQIQLIIRETINNGHLDVMKYLHSKSMLKLHDLHLKDIGGHFNCTNVALAIWLYYTFGLDELSTICLLCENGRLDELNKFVIKDDNTLYGALDTACAGGQIEVLKYLHRVYKLTERSINSKHISMLCLAADRGHSHVIKYLYDTYHFTIDDLCHPLYSACYNNNLDVVKTLHKIGITIDNVRHKDNVILRWCCRDHSLPTIKWLHSTFGFTNEDVRSYDNDLFYAVVYNNELSVVMWLCENFNFEVSDINEHLCKLCSGGHNNMVKWFCDNYEISAEDIGRDTFREMCKNNKELARYVYIKFEPYFRDVLFELVDL